MNTPLSDYWTVEYHFSGDAFSVRTLPDYLTCSQRAFHEGKFWDSVILALHPTHQGASDECLIWQTRRNQDPLSAKKRLQSLRPYVESLEAQAQDDGE